ncbi:MAG: PQQ-dependent sugar dehydrogenase [Pseudomonadota bacterium]
MLSWHRVLAGGLVGLALSFTVGCTAPAEPALKAQLRKTIVADDFKSPWAMAFISEHDALVTEKQGGLLRVDLRTGERVLIAGLPSDLVNTPLEGLLSDNAGLFDVALHPEFAANRWIYLTYSAGNDTGTTTKLIRARLVDNALRDIEDLFVATPYTPDERYHYGGGITFGPDGTLYLTVGERLYNEADQPADPVAQDFCDRRGKIYRFNDDGSIPQDNPTFSQCAAPGLFGAGIRASQGITTHPGSGAIWFSEHGTTQGDEINLLAAGANYGWPTKTTGGYRYEEYQPPSYPDRSFVDPKWAWLQTVAPTGLDFYQGEKFPEWDGDLIVGGLSRGSLWRVVLDDEEVISLEELLVNQRARTRDVAVSPGGEVYLVLDLMFAAGPDGSLEYSGGPAGQIVRLDR